jgi:hypothetical protein
MSMDKIMCEENVGGIDLALRALLGTVAIITLSLGAVTGWAKWVVVVVAFGGLFTSITRHCTLYSLLNLTTKIGNRMPRLR